MNPFRVVFKSTAVRLSALYIVLFALCAAFLVFYVTALSERILSQQTRETLEQEVTDVQRAYNRAGLNGMLRLMERRSRQPGANLYVIASPSGEILAGNVASVQAGVFDEEGWTTLPFQYERYSESGSSVPHQANAHVFVLDNGLRVLIGRDLGEPQKLRLLVRRALMVALGIMGLGALVIWFGIGRNALKRIDRMSAASTKIMAGDLSQRLPVGGSGDEFDRMSESLNAMLGRIEKLNEGLRQVSDNIAHDLKTPLTRLRNKAADALDQPSQEARRAGLEGIIAESDQLIRTFNALLMISRVEAGSVAAEMSDIDLSAIVTDSAELYEPVAEEAGMALATDIADGIVVHGNRELIGQAIFNLVDNAVKYGNGEPVVIYARRNGDEAVISVTDLGKGIPPQDLERVFDKFFRRGKADGRMPGTELGLAIAKGFVEAMGGTIEAGNREDGGAVFTVTLPVPAAGQPEKAV